MSGRPGRPAGDAPRADVPSLQAFVAVARLGTTGRAAEALGRTQPSISARLAALERAWGTRLFRREARGMRLTPEGGRLLPAAEAVLRDLEDLDRAAGVPVAAAGEVRVGAGDALGRERLPRALARLLAERPAVAVRILEGPGPSLLEALRAAEIDLALLVRPPERQRDGEMAWRKLLESPVDLLVPPGTRLPRRAAVSLRSLRGKRLVALQRGSSFRRHLEAAFAAGGLAFRPAVEVGNLSLVRRFVAAGLGWAPVPAVAFAERGTGGSVQRRRLAGVAGVAYFAAARRGVPLPAACLRLLELLV